MKCEVCGKTKIKTLENTFVNGIKRNLCDECMSISHRLHTFEHTLKMAIMFGGLQKKLKEDKLFAIIFRVIEITKVREGK